MTNWSERLRKAICWTTTILVGILPFVFCWLSDELFEFNKMQCVYAFASVIGCLCVARWVVEKKVIYRHTIYDWPLGFFLVSQIISTILSMHPRTSLLGYYTRLNGGLLSTLAYLVIYYAYVNNFDAKHRRWLFQVLLVSSSLVSLYAIGEHFGHSLSCLIIKGNFDVSCWVQDVRTRVYATLGQPNWLAAYNVTVIGLIPLLMLDVARRHGQKFLRIMAPMSLVLNFCSLLFTKSRSGIIACTAGIVLTLVLLGVTWYQQETKFVQAQIKVLAIALALMLIPALIWGTQYTPSLRDMIPAARAEELTMGLPEHLQGINTGITDSGDIRKIVWQGAIEIWKHYPFFGTGVESFAYSYYQYRPTDHNWTSEWDFLYNKAHNELLNFAANTGTVGLVAYLSIFVVLGVMTIRYLLTQRQAPTYITTSYLLIGVTASLLALSITNFFGFSTVSVQVLLYLFLGIAASTTAKTPIVAAEFTPAWSRPKVDETWQKITFVTIGIAGFYLLGQVWNTWYADYNYARCKSLITRASASVAMERCALAIRLRPNEALYYVELGNYYAQYALALAKQSPEETTAIGNLVDTGVALSERGMELNPNNLNFYKTRYQMWSSLAQIDPSNWQTAKTDLEEAMQRSPTDPKLVYYYAQVLAHLDDSTGAREYYEKAVSLRPLYLEARLAAAAAAEATGDLETARQHYLYADKFLDQRESVQAGLARLGTAEASTTEDEP